MAARSDDIVLLTTGAAGLALVGVAAIIGMETVRVPSGIDWPAWVQAIGTLVAVAIAIAIPAWQHTRDVRRARQDQEELFWLAVELLSVAVGTISATARRYRAGKRLTLKDHIQNGRRMASLAASLQSLSLAEIRPSNAAAEFLLGQTALWRAERRLSCSDGLPSQAQRKVLATQLMMDFELCRARLDRMCVARTGAPFVAHRERMATAIRSLPPIPPHLDRYWEGEDDEGVLDAEDSILERFSED